MTRTAAALTLIPFSFLARPVLAAPAWSDGSCTPVAADGMGRLVTLLPVATASGGSYQGRRRDAVTDVVQQVSSTVVAIAARRSAPRGNSFFEFADPRGGRPSRSQGTALGSGVIVESSGTIITNYHVIEGASQIRVMLADGREVPATLVGRAPGLDLAVLQISVNESLPAARLATSEPILGETVVAIGNPLGLAHTVTAGVISSTHRRVPGDNPGDQGRDFIQVDASINPGNSGGPLFNLDGEVTGITTMKLADGAEGIAFAIPAERVSRVLQEITRQVAEGRTRPRTDSRRGPSPYDRGHLGPWN